ncbi:MAG: CoA-binding protein [Bacteroidales bacterium]
MALKPRRVIFNPGTENDTFEEMLTENGIEAMEACTLVLLASKQY